MKLFDVYPLFNICPVKGQDCYVWDEKGIKYLDLYGGHAVISIGHSHPHYIEKIAGQLSKIGFYSNSIQNPLQHELARKMGDLSGYHDWQLFLCNSGAEANENAIKLASFITGRKRMVSYKKGFHGRTSMAVAITDNQKIVAPVNETKNAAIVPFNDLEATEAELKKGDVAAVIVEGIQGIGGINVPDKQFLEGLEQLCRNYESMLIIDEIQSGYGRSGRFFAHQYTSVKPDLVTVAKGMGNGFPVGGLLIRPDIEPWYGMLGTTFGGNHLACAASIAVLDVMKDEKLITKAEETGNYLMEKLSETDGNFRIRGKGLMIGLEFDDSVAEFRKKLLYDHKIFTGVSGSNMIRLLPPLTLTKAHADLFLDAFSQVLKELSATLNQN